MGMIVALSNGRSSSLMAPLSRAASACVLASFCQVACRRVPSEWNEAGHCRHPPSETGDTSGLRGQPSWGPSRDCSKIGPSVGINAKFFDGEARHVASKILAAVTPEWAGISRKSVEIPGAVQACRGWHRQL